MSGHRLKQLSCLFSGSRSAFRLAEPVLLATLMCCFLALFPASALAAANPMPVAATIIPLGDFCQKIGGDLVRVQVLTPPGSSPHVFEPSPSEMARAFQARVFVYIGAGLEPWAARLLHARGPKDLVVVEAARGIPLLEMRQDHHHGEAETLGHTGTHHGQEEGHTAHPSGNPHIWLDPVLAQQICRKIAASFVQADPAHRAQYKANLQAYLAALADLNRTIADHAKRWRLRDYVSFHPSFAYFARRYDLHNVGTIQTSPGREPTPRYLSNLIGTIHRFGIKAIFAEPQLNSRVAEVIAREAGVKVLRLDPLGGRPPYGQDYIQLMRHNLATLDQALQ
jgi:ABC-type Zn uptake system ZnuABC Zn-binding protein ZnuA